MAAYGTTSVGDTATLILGEASPRRIGAIIQAQGDGIYIGFDTSVTTSNGLLLNERESWETGDPQPYQGAVYGIVATGTVDANWQEVK